MYKYLAHLNTGESYAVVQTEGRICVLQSESAADKQTVLRHYAFLLDYMSVPVCRILLVCLDSTSVPRLTKIFHKTFRNLPCQISPFNGRDFDLHAYDYVIVYDAHLMTFAEAKVLTSVCGRWSNIYLNVNASYIAQFPNIALADFLNTNRLDFEISTDGHFCVADFLDVCSNELDLLYNERAAVEERLKEKAKLQAERNAREEKERQEREEAERNAREEKERQEREEAERKAREEKERQEREEAERKAREEKERQEREEAERKAREKRERQEREEAERKAREKRERQEREEAERNAREEMERQEREEAERKAREEKERQEREEAERKAREERERQEREDAERKAREEMERQEREEAERKAREEKERQEREEAERKAREERERQEREDAERNAREEKERQEREEAERKAKACEKKEHRRQEKVCPVEWDVPERLAEKEKLAQDRASHETWQEEKDKLKADAHRLLVEKGQKRALAELRSLDLALEARRNEMLTAWRERRYQQRMLEQEQERSLRLAQMDAQRMAEAAWEEQEQLLAYNIEPYLEWFGNHQDFISQKYCAAWDAVCRFKASLDTFSSDSLYGLEQVVNACGDLLPQDVELALHVLWRGCRIDADAISLLLRNLFRREDDSLQTKIVLYEGFSSRLCKTIRNRSTMPEAVLNTLPKQETGMAYLALAHPETYYLHHDDAFQCFCRKMQLQVPQLDINAFEETYGKCGRVYDIVCSMLSSSPACVEFNIGSHPADVYGSHLLTSAFISLVAQ